ncbi:uncharacterized protein METZ01_LOCUS277607 [marine metagenome]|uniref:Uncharacterized protein n=1 Tax=marine metagenome TaxID=408172 RepID=A0A382KMS6_9ZZZZ
MASINAFLFNSSFLEVLTGGFFPSQKMLQASVPLQGLLKDWSISNWKPC